MSTSPIIESAAARVRDILERAVVEDQVNGTFRVNRRAFVDEAILAEERRQIFGKCWLYLGHVSEVAKPGAFVTRSVGGRQLLFNRDRNGTIRAFHNSCTHRGALVTKERAGNRKAFQCNYHGWVFSDAGKLTMVPGEESMAATPTQTGALDLKQVPHLGEYRGFLFVNFDPQARTSLVDYLAGVADVLAIVADQGKDGMEIVQGTQEYSMHANWKLLQENSADGYHAAATHVTYFEYMNAREGERPQVDPVAARGLAIDCGNGHAYLHSQGTMPWGRPTARWIPSWGEDARAEVDEIMRELVARLGEERARLVGEADRNTLIFPNLVLNDIMAVTVRTFYPVRPDYTEVNAWALAPIGETESSRARRLKNFLEFLGPAGFATPDDVEMLLMCQRGYSNIDGVEWNDISRGMRNPTPYKAEEAQMRAFWRQWYLRVNGAQ